MKPASAPMSGTRRMNEITVSRGPTAEIVRNREMGEETEIVARITRSEAITAAIVKNVGIAIPIRIGGTIAQTAGTAEKSGARRLRKTERGVGIEDATAQTEAEETESARNNPRALFASAIMIDFIRRIQPCNLPGILQFPDRSADAWSCSRSPHMER